MKELKGDYNVSEHTPIYGERIKTVTTGEGDIVATFYGDGDNAAFIAFKNGLAHMGSASLYDVNRDQFIIGTLDQLAT